MANEWCKGVPESFQNRPDDVIEVLTEKELEGIMDGILPRTMLPEATSDDVLRHFNGREYEDGVNAYADSLKHERTKRNGK